jgi:hypothetical protein
MRKSDDRDYPVHEDPAFQARTWAAQRAAWALFVIIPVLGLSGLFAHGVLSEQTAGDGRALSIDYQRFQRVTDLSRFVVHIAPAQAPELRLSASFHEIYEIESIQPQPAHSTASADGLHLNFTPTSGGPLVAVIWARPRRFGRFALVAQSGAEPVTFNVLVYP